MTSVFDDTSLDERARPIIAAAHRDVPSEAALRQATLVEDEPSPAMLQHTARWIEVRDGLAREGLAPAQILRVFLRAVNRAYNVFGPGPAMLTQMFADAADTETAREVCEHLSTLDAPSSELSEVGTIAMAHLAVAAEEVPVRPTPAAQQALQYWLDIRAAERRAAELGPLAERVWSERAISVDAPELASMSAWEAAGERRQHEIAEAVVAELGPEFSLVGLERFGGPAIAVLSRDGERYCLVPGGVVEVGLSPEEEARIREAAEQNAGCGNHYELYTYLFEQLDALRPLTQVTVSPMLVAQSPGLNFAPQVATDVLEGSPLRLPSEAEWEYLARGGRSRELTYRGADVPDNEEWFETTAKLGAAGANRFGLWGFGLEPETCADVFQPGHDGLPTDGSPRRGAGPRVVKGGAAQLYPWQACGEWHLLLSAMRMPQTAWSYALALRFVIGIKTT